ncbi:MAG: hypothetical protein KGJ23_00500 [Euryarchaeota archaeon]|nr:hypothetical protein [Euryarchaeota archaeon]MDE1835076.1 hypothetical protein [Euryarchaeota archaeon]MDE2044962.1 hypothetical protein [Thermoplasmata archaeon]
MGGALRVGSWRETGPRGKWAPWAGAGALFLLVLLLLPDSVAHVAVAEDNLGSGGSQATPVPLSSAAANVRLRCGTAVVTTTVYPSSTRAQVTITLPRGCRGTAFTFAEPVRFTALRGTRGEIGLSSNSWTANMGRVAVCLARAGAGCTTNTMNLQSTSVPPLSTSLNPLQAARAFGPRITTTLGAPGGTATIVLTEEIAGTGARGTLAWVQQDQIVLSITQA